MVMSLLRVTWNEEHILYKTEAPLIFILGSDELMEDIVKRIKEENLQVIVFVEDLMVWKIRKGS